MFSWTPILNLKLLVALVSINVLQQIVMTRKKKHIKKKRQQSRPKKQKSVAKQLIKCATPFESQMRVMGKRLLKIFKDKEAVSEVLREHIETIEGYFRRYDSVQLLGSVGLYLLENLPNLEKCFIAQMNGSEMHFRRKRWSNKRNMQWTLAFQFQMMEKIIPQRTSLRIWEIDWWFVCSIYLSRYAFSWWSNAVHWLDNSYGYHSCSWRWLSRSCVWGIQRNVLPRIQFLSTEIRL